MKPQVLTRRGFLRLAGACSVSFSLSGCRAGSLPIRADKSGNDAIGRLPFSGLITSLADEFDYEARVEGRMPNGVRGTLYRNGIGLLERDGLRKRALMDGDGMVHSYTFDERGVMFRNRFVRTGKFMDESAAGAYIYPTFSTQAPGGMLANFWPGGRIRSQAQISVIVWNNRLYAFDESSYPYELDMTSLKTVGVTQLGLPEGQSLFSGHSKIDARKGEWLLFGLHYGRRVTLHTTIIDAAGALIDHRAITLPRYVYIHDFFATEKHLIFILHPLELDVSGFLLGLSSMSDSLRWRPEKGNLVLVTERAGKAAPVLVETDPCFLWHSLNAHEEKGAIIADFVGYDSPDHFIGPDAPVFAVMQGRKGSYRSKGLLRRYVIDMGTRKIRQEMLLDGNYEWPALNVLHRCHAYRFGYLAQAYGNDFFCSGITRIDTYTGRTDRYVFDSGQFCGEPVFVPRQGTLYSAESSREPGWIMTEVYDNAANKSFLAVFDAESLAGGPVARVHLAHHMPYSMHGFWHAGPG